MDRVRRVRLRGDASIHVSVRDESRFGSPLTTRPDESTRELFAPVTERLAADDRAAVVASSPALLREVVTGDAFRCIARLDGDTGWTLAADVLYPDVERVSFDGVVVHRNGRGVELPVPGGGWDMPHRVIAELSGRGRAAGEPWPDSEALLADAFRDADLLEEVDTIPEGDRALTAPGITFLGHNGVVVRSGSTRVVVDPFLRPTGPTYPQRYQPLTPREFGPVDMILLTHSHPDHFVPATLLQFAAEIPVVVPRIPRETVLAVAMAQRLRELGFTRVVELDWWESVRVGDIEVHALPFFGEQATDGPVLHPEIRNAGNTYVVRTPALSLALLADAGKDHSGDVKDMALEARARLGGVDVVFCGYRGWAAYPVHHLFSSVARYLLFVPPALWGSRLRLMNDVHDAVDVAERWGARALVPYADGGAPWFWDVGLGPRADEPASENVSVDPFPERVIEAAASRVRDPRGASIGSPVSVVLLRPNESLLGAGEELLRVVRHAKNAWPYGQAVTASR